MEWLTVAKSSIELHPHAVLLSILVATLSALLLRKAIVGRTNQYWPPGPPAWPIIGHLHLLGELPHQSLCKLAQSYGPLMGLRFGSVPTIIASSPAMAKEILQTHDLAFANRPRLAAAVHMCCDCTDVAYAPYGPHWKFLRQLYASELFSAKRLDAFRHVREEEVRALTRSVLQHGAEEVELRPILLMTSNNINCRMVMGKKMTEVSIGVDKKLELTSVIEEVLHLCGVFYLGDYIPWLACLDTNGYLKRMKKTGRRIKALFQELIDKRRESQRGGRGRNIHDSPQDLLDILLDAASQNKDQDIKLTDDNIVAALQDIFTGGADTSSVSVEWALADLMSNPDVMQKMQEELDNVVGRERLVEEADIPKLAYLGSVVKESMRLHPIAPLLIPHETMQECQIGGYRIPAKSRAYVNTWAIGRDAATWESPLEFRPERFDVRNIDLRGQSFELLPFGVGRRRCPGWALGLLNVHLMLAALVQSFTWSVESPSSATHGSHTPTIDMSEMFGLTVAMRKPLHAFAKPRLPLHLY